MRWKTYSTILLALLLTGLFTTSGYAALDRYNGARDRGPQRILDIANPADTNRVHDAGKMWMNITNYGYFGNDGPGQDGALQNPCPPEDWAPQCEFPGGSGQQYLFQGALWIGALIEEEGFFTTRVSVGTDGWQNPSINEFHAGEGSENLIKERSNRPGFSNCFGEQVYDSFAVSDQDFIAVMTDTLTSNTWVRNDPTDGPHRPLGIKITQISYSFSQAFAEDFILIDYEIENIASNFLKNVYVGLYVDSDCGVGGDLDQHTDDVCGFVRSVDEVDANNDTTTIRIDVAWIADGDGYNVDFFGGDLYIPHVTGTRVIRAPNPRLFTSFNWYNPNGDSEDLAYGPAWEAYAERDSMGMGWTETDGYPAGDAQKYQLMSNGEFDLWQTSIDELSAGIVLVDSELWRYRPDRYTPQTWSNIDLDEESAPDIADGYDTRYLMSWGPLGLYDFTDGAGNDIYRLNPGEKFRMTIAYVGGEYFHDSNNPQIAPTNLDTAKYDFSDLKENARWAKDVYDNRMHDTPIFDWGLDGDRNVIDEDSTQGDGILDTGDGWYGEDVGNDGLFGVLPIGVDSVRVIYFNGADEFGAGDWTIEVGWYTGPDADGSERNGRIDTNLVNTALNSRGAYPASTEDEIIPRDLIYAFNVFHPLQLGPWDMGWMYQNGILDMGDGIPDFTGPPPPPIPALMDCYAHTQNAAQHSGGIVKTGCAVGGLGYELGNQEVILRWSASSSENTSYRDPFSRLQDFEGYRIHVSTINQEQYFELKAQFDRIDFAYFSNDRDSLMTTPVTDTTGMPQTVVIRGVPGTLRAVGLNTGFGDIEMDEPGFEGVYEFPIPANTLAPRYYAITAFDYGDPKSGLTSLSTRATANAVLLAPAGEPGREVTVVPNPYRAYEDYTQQFRGQSWENQNDGTRDFYPQVDRRLEFMNLPERALIRIFTTAGDLVQIIPHNAEGDRSSWASLNSEKWDLNSRNNQQVVSGLYLFSVEDLSDHSISTGKFVIIR